MKRIKYISLYIILLIVSIMSFESCVNEDLSSCPKNTGVGNVSIYFSYFPKDIQLRGINSSDVKSLSLFVFDSNGNFVLSKTDNEVVLNKNYYMMVNLDPGKYTFVVWGNLDAPFYTIPSVFEPGITNIGSAILFLRRPTSNLITSPIPNLFYANYIQGQVTASEINRFFMPLKQNTNNIKLIVKGLPVNNDIYDYTITDNNSKYDFFNNFVVDPEFNYTTSGSLNADKQFRASLNVLRLSENRKAMLELYNQTTNKSVYKHDLIDLLLKLSEQNQNIDWENTHDFEIVITFEVNLDITITINGWNVVTGETQLP